MRRDLTNVIGYIPRNVDCSMARHGIANGLSAAFSGTIETGHIGFGLPTGPDKNTPVTCDSKQVDDAQSDLAFQWVRGFCQGFLYRS